MATLLRPEALKLMFQGHKKGMTYVEAAKLYYSIRVHADGEMPIRLIKSQRPNESKEVMDYRFKIYEPETLNPVEKVFNVLEKIRRSPDWMMHFNEENTPAIIDPRETLKQYVTSKYPTYGSLENWLFEEVLRVAGIDANAVIAVIPKDYQVLPNQYIEPVAKLFPCTCVVDFVPDDYAVLKSEELSSLLSPEQQQTRIISAQTSSKPLEDKEFDDFRVGQVYYHINTVFFEKWEETSDSKYQLTAKIAHGLNKLPVFQMGGKFVKRVGNNILKKSPLQSMVPHLNKAARESSDLDAGVIKHLHLQKWRINSTPCQTCDGVGKIPGGNNVVCNKCKGSGVATGNSPFDEIIVKPSSIGDPTTPIPPVGYVALDPEILRLQNERIEKHLYKALSSINMEHLAEVPLVQSGVAKGMDRDEATTIVYMFAEYLTKVANDSIYFINELRYQNLIPNEEKRKAMLPIIPVPEKFDIINTSFLLDEYKASKDAGLNSTILAHQQIEIASKKFYANPNTASIVNTIMDLDPFPDKTIEEKGLMASQGLAAKEDIILSNYISGFVNEAIENDPQFLTKSKKEKRDVLLGLAKQKLESLNSGKQISQDIFPQN